MRVYADWLMQQGHPAGELVAIQLERLAHDSEALAQREADVAWQHVVPYFRKVLARDDVNEWEARGGLLHSYVFHQEADEGDIAATIRGLAADPYGRLVRRLEIKCPRGFINDVTDLSPGVAALAAARFPRLRELALGERTSVGTFGQPVTVGTVASLGMAYPQLEVFELAGHYELGELAFPALKKLALTDMAPMDGLTIALAELPVLESLQLVFRHRVDDIVAVFGPLLERAMPTLTHLSIGTQTPQVMQYLVRAVPASALAKHVRVLAFPGGAIDDDCVRTLLQWAPRLRALERLELTGGGHLAPASRHTLAQALGRTVVFT